MIIRESKVQLFRFPLTESIFEVLKKLKGNNMKCIKKADKVMRVPEHVAEERIKQGWSYVPKSEWKGSGAKDTIAKPVAVASDKPKKKRTRKPADDTDMVGRAMNKKD